MGGGPEQNINANSNQSLLSGAFGDQLKELQNDLGILENKFDDLDLFSGNIETQDKLTLNSTAKTNSIIPQSDDKYDLGSKRKGWDNAYVHQLWGSSILTIGDGNTSHSLTDTDDLLVSGNLEVDGNTFLDGNTTFGGTIDAGNNLISNLLDPVSAQDAATKNYVDVQIDGASYFSRIGTTLSPTTSGDDLDMTGGLITFDSLQTFGGSTLTELGYLSTASSDIQLQITGLDTDKQDSIVAGTSSQYYRGDKTWQTLNQSAIAGLTTSDSPMFAGGTFSTGGIDVTGTGTFNNNLDVLGNLAVVGDTTTTGNLDVAGGATIGGSDERVNGTNSYIDFNDGGSGSVVLGGLGNTNNENIEFDFETTANNIIVSSNSGVTEVKYSGLDLNIFNGSIKGYLQDMGEMSILASATAKKSLWEMLAWVSPATIETGLINGNTFAYKNVTTTEVTTVGDGFQIETTGNNEYVCTDVNSDTTCDDDADFTFLETNGDGFAIWGWFNVTDITTTQMLIAKWESTQVLKEYNLQISGGEILFTLADASAGNCGNTTIGSGLSTGWHQIGVKYDGSAGVDADLGVEIYYDGVRKTMYDSNDCSNYTAMEDTTAPMAIGTARSGGTPNSLFQGNIGFIVFKKLPGTADISDAQWLRTYNAEKEFMGQ